MYHQQFSLGAMVHKVETFFHLQNRPDVLKHIRAPASVAAYRFHHTLPSLDRAQTHDDT